MSSRYAKMTSIAVLFLSSSAIGPSFAGEAVTQKTTMHRFADQSGIAFAGAELTRMDHGIYMTIETVELPPGDAVTAWYVVFNKPENCSGGECGEDDIFNMDENGKFIENDDGSPPFNTDGIEAASVSILRADGRIIDIDGKGSFRGHLPVEDSIEAIFGPGLTDSRAAEVHAVLRTHRKPAPGTADEMLNSINGGCADEWPNEPCEDLQFAVFKPAM